MCLCSSMLEFMLFRKVRFSPHGVMMASAAPLTLLLLRAERKEWELRQGQ